MWTLDTRIELTAPDLTGYAPTERGRRHVKPLMEARDAIVALHRPRLTEAEKAQILEQEAIEAQECAEPYL